MAFTADQLLLLNTLSYLSKDNVHTAREGMTVAEFIAPILASSDTMNSLTEDGMTAGDITQALNRIQNDPSLMEMQFSHVSQSEGGANRYVLTTPEGAGAREAVLVLEGTTGAIEWRDDGLEAATTDQADGVSTEMQVKTQEWYQSNEVQQILQDCDHITVTGHSKGGNSAKYLTLMNDEIDACVSFDGQGFSDEFIEKYRDRIAQRQDIVENYSNADDYVNFLLNDFGERHYIQGTPQDNFLINHSIFTLVHSESLSSKETVQNPVIAEFDKILNGYLRTLEPEERQLFGKIVGEILADKLGSDKVDVKQYMKWLFWDGGMTLFKDFIKYAAKSAAARCVIEWMKSILGEDSPVVAMLEQWFGLGDDVRGDKVVESSSVQSNVSRITVDSDVYVRIASQLNTVAAELASLCNSLSSCAADCDDFHILFQLSVSLRLRLAGAVSGLSIGTPGHVLRKTSKSISKLRLEVERLSHSAGQAESSFEALEQRNISRIPDTGLPSALA